MTSYQDLFNETTLTLDQLEVSGSTVLDGPVQLSSLSAKGILELDSSNNIFSQVLTNGQTLIGNSGNVATPSTLTGGSGINILNGPGSITISATGSFSVDLVPTVDSSFSLGSLVGPKRWLNLYLNGVLENDSLTGNSLVTTNSSKQLVTNAISNTSNGTNFSVSAGQLICDMTQNLSTSGGPTFDSLTLGTTASINFPGLDNFITYLNSSSTYKFLIGNATIFSITSSGASVSGLMNCSSARISGLSPSLPLHLDVSRNVTSGLIDLTADVTGILPIAQGGTNSSTPLTNGFLMASNAGEIVEWTSSNTPAFQEVSITNITSKLVAADATHALVGTTINNVNGCNFNLQPNGLVLNATMTQNLGSTGQPQFLGMNITGLTASNLVGSDASKNLVTYTIGSSQANGNTSTLAYSGSSLQAAFSNQQDISSTASPTWAGLTINTGGITSLGIIHTAITSGSTSFCALMGGPQNAAQSTLRLGLDNGATIHPCFIWVDQTGTQSLNFASRAAVSPWTATTPDVTLTASLFTSNVPLALGTNAINSVGSITSSGSFSNGTNTLGTGAITNTSLTASGALSTSLTTDSSSTSTGCLILSGGAGIAKNVYCGSDVHVGSTVTTQSASVNGGAFTGVTSLALTRAVGGGWEEVYRSDPEYAGSAVTTNWTTDSGAAPSILGLCPPYPYGLFNPSGSSTGWLRLDVGTLATGIYMVEYYFGKQNNTGINKFLMKGNGAGFLVIRDSYDCYSATSISMPFRDFFTITTAGDVILEWLCGGSKNASSTAFFVCIPGPVVVTKIG